MSSLFDPNKDRTARLIRNELSTLEPPLLYGFLGHE